MAKKSVGRARLLKLADFLETDVERKRFNMTAWAQFAKPLGKAPKNAVIPIKFGPFNEIREAIRSVPKCGTAACALGWGTAMPSLYKLGLRVVDNRSKLGDIAIFERIDSDWVEKHSGVSDVCKFLFGITDEWSELLFVPNGKPPFGQMDSDQVDYKYDLHLNIGIPKTPKEAAKHIRHVVKLISNHAGPEGFAF